MVDVVDIRSFEFPTLAAESGPADLLAAIRVLRGESDRKGRRRSTFRESDREKFQRAALTGDSRLDRVLATLDAIAQQNPAAVLAGALPGPIGGIAGLGALSEAQLTGGKPGDLLRELAGSVRREGRAITSRRGGGRPTAVEREFRQRAEREDRRANRDLREGRGSGASPRRGDVSNAGR